MNNTLLDRWGGSSVPALRERESPEPRESELFENRGERGRSPDEVLQPRGREYVETPVEPSEETSPAAGKTTKIVVNGREYELNEQQQRNFEAAMAQQQQAAAAPPVITNVAIDQVYRPIAKIIVEDLIKADLLDADLAEVYDKSILTMVGQLRFAFDKIFETEEKQNRIIQSLNLAIQRLEQTIAFLHAKEGPQGTGKRQDKQFLPTGKSAVLLNKMVANSGRIRQ